MKKTKPKNTFKNLFLLALKRLSNAIKSAYSTITQWILRFFGAPSSTQTTPHPSTVASAALIASLDKREARSSFTPLMRAVYEGDITQARALLALGANVEAINYNSDRGIKDLRLPCWYMIPNTALEIAIRNENLEMVKLLLEHNAQIKLDHLSRMLKNKADSGSFSLRRKEPSSDSVLDFLPDEKVKGEALKRRAEIVRCITVKGAKLDPKSILFKLMIEAGEISTVKKTLINLENISKFLDSKLYNLGIYNEPTIGRFISIDLTYHTPISYALSCNQTIMVDHLLNFAHEKLSEAEYRKVLEKTFIDASYYNNLSIIKSCVQRSDHLLKNIDTVGSTRSTLNALKTAATMGSITVLKYLLKQGADINHRNDQHFLLSLDDKENTALFFALKSNLNKKKEETVIFLLNNGAKLDSFALGLIKDTNFSINLDPVYCPIEFMDTPRWTRSYKHASCKDLVEQYEKHNEVLHKKTVDILDEVFEQKIPPVLTSMIGDYLFPLATAQKPPKAINNAPNQIQRTKGLT